MPQGEGDTTVGQQGDLFHVIDEYQQAELARKSPRTLDAYMRILRQLALWLSTTYGTEGLFHPEDLTQAAVATYVGELRKRELSLSHLRRTLSVLNRFCNWLMTRGVLSSNPTHGIVVSTPPANGEKGLTAVQRSILRRLVEQPQGQPAGSVPGGGGDLRGAAVFALAYWVGCSVSEISSLLVSDAHLEGEVAWLHIGTARGASRAIPLREEARVALANYLSSATRCQASAYLFTSQRERAPIPATEPDGWRLGEAALHAWWRSLKAGAAETEWPLLGAITLLDLRHDFKQRAEEAAWPPEVLRVYLGYASRQKAPSGQIHRAVTLLDRPDLEKQLRALRG